MRSREERPKKPDRHGKGKIIIMWLLFMPLFAIGSTCLYGVFNDNAYKSYESINNDNQEYETISSENLIQGEIYYFENPYLSPTSTTQSARYYEYNFTDFQMIQTTYATSLNSDINSIRINYSASGDVYVPYIKFGINGTYTSAVRLSDYTFFFKFRFLNCNNNALNYSSVLLNNLFVEITYDGNVNYINNSFYYAIDKVQQSPLFNWSSNNIIYTGMHSMCTTMNITTTFVPFILTYWILISIIYMLFDIEFTLLWKLHEKIHDLTESL